MKRKSEQGASPNLRWVSFDVRQKMDQASASISERMGLLILALSFLLASANSMLFVVATRLPVAAITSPGLIGNTLAVVAAWIVLLKGERTRLALKIVSLLLFAAIHHTWFSNIIAVTVYDL
jgi:hypothetical protein